MALPGSPLIHPRIQFFDTNGDPLSGGKLWSYAAGTTTPQPLYTDADLDPIHAATNPVILNAYGAPATNLYMSPTGYKFELTTALDVVLWTADEIEDPPYVVFDTLANVMATGARDTTDGYVILATDNTVTVLPNPTPNPCQVVLPAAVGRGFPLTIINKGLAVPVVVTPSGSDTISGLLGGLTLPAGVAPVHSGVTLHSDGVSDWLLASFW